MKVLRVGDPHVKVSNLEESRALINFVANVAKFENVDRIEILGDLFHTHAVLRLEIQEFWLWALNLLSDIKETVVLVGNHDLSGDYSSSFSALNVFSLLNKKTLIIVTEPVVLGDIGYVSYVHDNNKFIDLANSVADKGAKVLVCHQTFQGSKYESGFYAADGIPLGEWSERFTHIISGHIHAEQNFGNVIYPGTARWDSISDANQRKGIWTFVHRTGVSSGANGRIQESNFITTENVCSPLKSFSWIYGEPEANWASETGRVTLELVGPSDWIAEQRARFKGKLRIKTKITDSKSSERRKAGINFEDYLKNFYPVTADREGLLKLAKEFQIV